MATLKHIEVDERQAPRILYRDLNIIYNGATEAVDRRSPDLTPQGMFINTPREFPEGALLTLRFDLVRSGVIVQAVGEVRYCLPGVGVGVQFVELASSLRSAIEDELEELQK